MGTTLRRARPTLRGPPCRRRPTRCHPAPPCTSHGGTYAQRVDIHVSGEPGRPITFAPAPGEAVVLDGSSLEVPAGQSAMIGVDSQRYVTIQGFEITGYRSDASGHVPIGILVTGAADHVRLDGNVGARSRDHLQGTQRRRCAWDRCVRHDERSPDRRCRDRRQRACQPHPRLLRGAGRERQRHGLPDPREPCPRHEQHRDRRDRVRGDRARSDGRPGPRRDRAGQHGVERRQLRQPRYGTTAAPTASTSTAAETS